MSGLSKEWRQAGAELSQAQVRLKVIAEVGVELVVEGWVDGWVWKMKLMLSFQLSCSWSWAWKNLRNIDDLKNEDNPKDQDDKNKMTSNKEEYEDMNGTMDLILLLLISICNNNIDKKEIIQ